jgi:hypothetical protein
LFFLSFLGLSGAEIDPLTRLSELETADPTLIESGIPVDFEGVVTYFDPNWSMMFLQQFDQGVFVIPNGIGEPPVPGNKVRLLVTMPLRNSGCNRDHLILCGTDLITVFRQSRPTNDRLA